MTRDEYLEMELPEATVTFFDDPGLNETYVRVSWMGEEGSDKPQGFKFIVATEFIQNITRLRR